MKTRVGNRGTRGNELTAHTPTSPISGHDRLKPSGVVDRVSPRDGVQLYASHLHYTVRAIRSVFR